MVYDFHESPLRVVQDALEMIWFVFRDAALALGYGNPDQVRTRIPEANLRQMEVENTRGHIRETWCINLEGLNYLIFGSEKPEAEEFKKLAASIMAEFQTTGQVLPRQQPLLDVNQPVAHLAEATRKQTSNTISGVAFAVAGREGAIAAHTGLSLEFFGLKPKVAARVIQQEHGKNYVKSKSLPQVLTENVPHVAASYSAFRHMVLLGHDVDKAKSVAKAFEPGFQAAIEAGLDPQSLLPQQ